MGIAVGEQLRVRWFGREMGEEHIAVSARGVDLSTAGPATFYSVTIDGDELQRLFPNAPDVVTLLEACQAARLERNPIYAQRLRAYFQRIFRVPPRVRRHTPSSPRRTTVHGTLLPLLARALHNVNGASIEESRHLTRRVAAVRKCEAFMRAHLAAEVTLLELSQVSGIRMRSLINAFEAVTGLSPMVYLKRLRLSGARQALRHANKRQTRIIDIASEWGFWHMGHFAATYRAMFGETPTETLRNS